MKIGKKILISTLTVMVTLSIIMGTLMYAQKYTSSHTLQGNSFQNGNKRMPQGGFQKNDNTKFKGGPSNGNFKKPEN